MRQARPHMHTADRAGILGTPRGLRIPARNQAKAPGLAIRVGVPGAPGVSMPVFNRAEVQKQVTDESLGAGKP